MFRAWTSPVAQAEDVAHHGHDGQGAGVVGPPVKPDLEEKSHLC